VPEPLVPGAAMPAPFAGGLVNSMVVLRVSAGATVDFAADSAVECVSQRIRRVVSSSAEKQAKEVANLQTVLNDMTFDNEIDVLIAADALGEGQSHRMSRLRCVPATATFD
jgi:hypothetical protein